MKKLYSALIFAFSAVLLTTFAFADVAPMPERLWDSMQNVLIPIIIAVVILAVGILVKVIRGRKK